MEKIGGMGGKNLIFLTLVAMRSSVERWLALYNYLYMHNSCLKAASFGNLGYLILITVRVTCNYTSYYRSPVAPT